jgi:hypothetical protein
MFNFKKNNHITFTVEKHLLYQYEDCIVEAKDAKPEWLTSQPLYGKNFNVNSKITHEPLKYKSLGKSLTAFGCPAMRDFYETGYIVRSWSDMLITKTKLGELIVQTPSNVSGICEFLESKYMFPEGNYFKGPIIRLASKIEMSTSKNISLLQLSALEGYPQIKIFEGYVPTDVYPIELKVPFAILGDFEEIYIPYGTPLLRLIPMKREYFVKDKKIVDTLPLSNVSKCPFFKLGKHLSQINWSFARNYFK